jgi:hypothetical protein
MDTAGGVEIGRLAFQDPNCQKKPCAYTGMAQRPSILIVAPGGIKEMVRAYSPRG